MVNTVDRRPQHFTVTMPIGENVRVTCQGDRRNRSACDEVLFSGRIEAFTGQQDFKCKKCYSWTHVVDSPVDKAARTPEQSSLLVHSGL